MYRCHICRSLHNAPNALVQHLKFFHGLYPGQKFVLICAQDACSLQFKSFKGFKKHLSSCHSTATLGTNPDCPKPHQSDDIEHASQGRDT